MWTLQRPNKGPDKKWRLNKESKYSSLLRPKKKQDQVTNARGSPPTPFIYHLPGGHPDLRAVDPRLADTRLNPLPRIPNGGRSYDPRFVDQNFMEQQRPPVGPRNSDPTMPDSRNVENRVVNSKMDQKPVDPRSNGSKTLDNRAPDSKLIYTRPADPKRPAPKMESNSSESEDEPYRRIRSKTNTGWIGFRKRDASLDRRRDRPPPRELQKTHHSEMDLRTKPLEDLNGREKHVERFLASLEANREALPIQGMEVISRQRILSRSRDDLITNHDYEDDEDIWFDLDELVKEHVHEILKKWEQIDDGIWAKAIVFEKNRRVAKAYVRPPILTVNGSDVGFDGHRIGLRGFDNPMRDAKTLEVISRYVGPGVKIRMNSRGNIEVKKMSHYNVYAKPLGEESAISDEICKTPNMTLDSEKQVVFDIMKFEQNVNRELRKAYPNRAKLENQCIMVLAFSKPGNILQCPSWVMIINIVAMDMLRSKLPTGLYVKFSSIKNRPRLPVPEEDPYSLTGAGSGTSSGGSSGKEKGKDKPPKLPPRDNPSSNKSSSKGDYDSPAEENVFRRFQMSRKNNTNSNSKDKDRKYDDPYYCGLRARIPNFAKQPKGKDRVEQQTKPQYLPHPQMTNPTIFHSRSVDSGMAYMQHNQAPYIYKYDRNPCSLRPPPPVGYDSDFTESPYSQIYGRLPLANRPFLNPGQIHPQGFYGRDWD